MSNITSSLITLLTEFYFRYLSILFNSPVNYYLTSSLITLPNSTVLVFLSMMISQSNLYSFLFLLNNLGACSIVTVATYMGPFEVDI
jgi:chromosome condensin MukBEF MukE localization factor